MIVVILWQRFRAWLGPCFLGHRRLRADVLVKLQADSTPAT